MLAKQLFEPILPLPERRLRDDSCKFHPVGLRNAVQNRDGRAVAKEDALGVDGYRISHTPPIVRTVFMNPKVANDNKIRERHSMHGHR